MELQTQIEQGFLPQIQSLEREQLKLRSDIAIAEQEYKESEAYKKYLELSRKLTQAENNEQQIRVEAKNIMLMNQLKEFTTLDWTKIMIKKTPWSIKVEPESEKNVPEQFWKISRSIDKTKLKTAFNEWLINDAWIYIDYDYTLQITYK